MSLDEWLNERHLSSRVDKPGEDFHKVVFSEDGLTRLVVRQVSSEALKAYRRLPESLRVDISAVSPMFLSNGIANVFVEYVDRRDTYGAGFTGLELSSTKVSKLLKKLFRFFFGPDPTFLCSARIRGFLLVLAV
jgi:hypothetical protein